MYTVVQQIGSEYGSRKLYPTAVQRSYADRLDLALIYPQILVGRDGQVED
jgi:hypothetical protein